MNEATLNKAEVRPEGKRRLTKKVRRRDFGLESVALQRHRARVNDLLRVQRVQGASSEHGVELTDDVLVFDRQGNRLAYPVIPIDQLPRFQKK